MVQREWVEKDFYKVLGVSSDAKDDEIKRVARKLLAENHPDRNPNNPAAEERYKEIGEAKDVAAQNPDVVKRLLALAEASNADLGVTGIGPGCRPLGRVADPKPIIALDGTVRADMAGAQKRFP